MFELVLKLVFGLAAAGVVAWQAYRMRKAATEPIAEGQCVACDSTDLEILAPGAYRCRVCGYEGGSGVAAAQAQARQQTIATLSPQERQQQAAACLEDALGMLQRADDSPLSMTAEDRLSWLNDIEGALVHAQAQFERAIEYAGQPVVTTERGRFDAGRWVQRIATEGPRVGLQDVGRAAEKVKVGRLGRAKKLRAEVRQALLQAIGNV